MSRFSCLAGVLLVAALAVADAQDSPAVKEKTAAIRPDPRPAARVVSPHGTPVRSRAGDERAVLQPGRVEYSYPLNDDQERGKSVKGLQQLTVDLLALHSMYKQAHWNVNGPLFLPLDAYYRRQAEFYRQQADLFADRVVQLGSPVDGRISTIASTSRIAELPEGYLTDDHSLKLLLDRASVLQKEVYELIGTTPASDAPTSEKLKDLAYAVDSDLWHLRAHIQKPSSRRGDLPWFRQQAHEPPGR